MNFDLVALERVFGEIFRPEKFIAPIIGFIVIVVGGMIYAAVERRNRRKRIEKAMLR